MRQSRMRICWSRVSLGLVAGALIASTGSAAMLVNEPFSYPDGALVGNTPLPGPGGTWGTHSGTAGQVQVSGGQITLIQGNSEDVNIPLGQTMGPGDRLYAAFNLTLTASANPTNVYFAMFMEGTSFFTGRIWVTAPTGTGYRLAISNDNSITDNDGEVFTGDLAFSTTYRVVHSYDYDSGVGRLWINPIDETSSSVAASDPGFSDAIGAYAFRQAAGNSTQVIDNLCVATTFNEALNCEPSQALSANGGSTPNTVAAGNTSLLTVSVAGGTPPYTVSANLTPIGGSATQTFYDDGSNGDVTAGDKVFSYRATVPCSQPPTGPGNPIIMQATVTDAASATVNPMFQIGEIVVEAAGYGVQPSNVTVCAGETATFTVQATGGGITYQWYNNAGALADGGRISGATTAQLRISSVQASDVTAGPYYVVANSACAGPLGPSNSATLTIGTPATATQKQVVISQVYGGGGNSGAPYQNDYIELYNTGAGAVDVNGWSVQYAASGTSTAADFSNPPRTVTLSGTIGPKQYYLIQLAAGTSCNNAPCGVVLPVTPDATGTVNLGSTAGKVALVNNPDPLSQSCPYGDGTAPTACSIVDFVGWGSGVTCSIGAPAPATSNTTALTRKDLCSLTGNNATDFEARTPIPHNTSSPSTPQVVQQPSNAVICAGSTATFTLVASSPCALTYKWQRLVNGIWTDVTTGTGATTASYTTDATTAGDDGAQYRAIVANTYGSTTSSVATIALDSVTPADRQVVIAAVYPVGGNSGAVYNTDYVQLYHRGTTAVDLTGWSLQYAAATGTNWGQKVNLSGTLYPGGLYLIAFQPGTNGDPLPVTPNVASTSFSLGSSGGKLALLKTTVALPNEKCPSDCRIVDLVGYGTADCYEGDAAAPVDSLQAIVRSDRCVDTDQNGTDFVLAAPAPATSGGSAIAADFDNDGKVNAADFDIFKVCVTGAAVPYDPLHLPAGCTVAVKCGNKAAPDFDKDGDIDINDFGFFQRCISGDQPADPACAE